MPFTCLRYDLGGDVILLEVSGKVQGSAAIWLQPTILEMIVAERPPASTRSSPAIGRRLSTARCTASPTLTTVSSKLYKPQASTTF
jgi:hypothetical protein